MDHYVTRTLADLKREQNVFINFGIYKKSQAKTKFAVFTDIRCRVMKIGAVT